MKTAAMEILAVNPNTTASMTDKIRQAAEGAAAPGTRIAVNPTLGPESIEGFYDEAPTVPGLLEEIAKGEARGVAGYVIACFDDTGLDAARALTRAPVVGIGEAAFHLASLVAGRFSVVTTLGRAIRPSSSTSSSTAWHRAARACGPRRFPSSPWKGATETSSG